MEEYLCRAMEVARLTDSELERLQNHEKKDRVLKEFDPITNTFKKQELRIRKILRPFEIQECLKLCTLKEQYGIPVDDDFHQNMHNQRLRKEMKDLKLTPLYDFHVHEVDKIHPWDWEVKEAVKAGKISFYYQSGGMGKKRVEEELA